MRLNMAISMIIKVKKIKTSIKDQILDSNAAWLYLDNDTVLIMLQQQAFPFSFKKFKVVLKNCI